ncbi:MAG TPA: hypothetical protein PKH53_09795, partial [Candidatus Saccharicenans sp.]|nr:hypothetical protein [Candidatus Saccharicenans sp.]
SGAAELFAEKSLFAGRSRASLFLALVDKWGKKKIARVTFFLTCLLFDAFVFHLIDFFIFKP